jgi:MbtH protein
MPGNDRRVQQGGSADHNTRFMGAGGIVSDQYRVLVNHEEQYSLWPLEKAIPPGWRDAGKSGDKVECLKFVDEVWVDMRPLSLRSR